MKITKLLAACTLVVAAIAISSCAEGNGSSCPFSECGGQCVDTNHDVANCGACGTVCGPGEVCSAGACAFSCPSGLVECGDSCVDPDTNAEHCGASGDCQGANAGDVCAAGEVCNGSGTCALTCQVGLIDCGGTCIDPDSDDSHCGASGDCQAANAGDVCVAGERCNGSGVCALSCQTGLIECNGTCVDPDNDEAFCGASGDCLGVNNGDICDPGEQCDGSGVCELSCQSGLLACSGTCIDPNSNPTYCGAVAACSGYTTCAMDEACVEGRCIDYIPTCTLYAIDNNRAIYQVNKSTGALTFVSTGGAAAGTTAALTYRGDIDTVYVSSTSADTLSTLDIVTGAVTLVGTFSDTAIFMHGLEWNPWNNKLYGMSSHDAALYEINTTTGVETLIGATGTSSFGNLGFDSRNGVMYMTSAGTDSAYTINLTTGAVTLLGPLNTMTNPNALAYDAENDVMYVIDNGEDELGVLNRTTGSVTTLGTAAGNLIGLVCLPP